MTNSCLVSDLQFVVRLADVGAKLTDVEMAVSIPEAEAHRLPDQQRVITASLRRLGALAARSSPVSE